MCAADARSRRSQGPTVCSVHQTIHRWFGGSLNPSPYLHDIIAPRISAFFSCVLFSVFFFFSLSCLSFLCVSSPSPFQLETIRLSGAETCLWLQLIAPLHWHPHRYCRHLLNSVGPVEPVLLTATIGTRSAEQAGSLAGKQINKQTSNQTVRQSDKQADRAPRQLRTHMVWCVWGISATLILVWGGYTTSR